VTVGQMICLVVFVGTAEQVLHVGQVVYVLQQPNIMLVCECIYSFEKASRARSPID
jgi:hypothetical protein